MKMQSGVDLMTVKDISEYIAFDGSDSGIERTMRQVRHWTQCDLLRTASMKNTGKGIPRLYEEEPTMWIAAILQELTLYGATVDILKPVADELYDHWDNEAGMYLWSAQTDINAFLQVTWTLDPKTGKFCDANIHMFDDMDKKAGENLLDEHPSSSVVVNMSMVSERIYNTPTIILEEANEVDHD